MDRIGMAAINELGWTVQVEIYVAQGYAAPQATLTNAFVVKLSPRTGVAWTLPR